ncbi:MAG TPA: penicillin acylase family protein [Gammaproteobacteria bacterium]|nr:penicillin acylase family protein [Gammaproteobacteria bacterium]
MRRSLRIAGIAVLASIVLVAGAALWLRHTLRASLPDYNGTLPLAGLTDAVTVERDDLGVVTVRAVNRADEARALGFVHAQERFFQMDLLRRSAAGELAALVGTAAIATDRDRRIHRLRETAERVVHEMPEAHRRLLEAYAEGVNAGLAALEARPFEYLLLRQKPAPWSPVDSILVVSGMYFDLQQPDASFKQSELIARQVLPEAVADLLYPRFTPWDAPLVGEPGPPAAIPPPSVYDLARIDPDDLVASRIRQIPTDEGVSRVAVGSNNWAVDGDLTATGAAMLANDLHLGLRTPSIWFRASLVRGARRVTGATLPGLPAIVFGSNGDIAWGVTNSYGDWTDLVVLEPDPANASRYLTPDGAATIAGIHSPIDVAGGATIDFSFDTTPFGPVIGTLPDGRRLAVRWVAHLPEGYALDYWDLADATDVAAAIRIAQTSGIPAQNFVVADRAGDIGWTIAGSIPRRRSNGRARLSSEDPAWDGWLRPDEYPAVVDPGDELIWTANGRVVEGEMLAAIGDGNYDLGARAGQIRERLRELGDSTTAADMLAIQLDDEALFLDRWREALLELLETESDPLLEAVRDAVRDSGDRARPDSVGYRLVRGWRLHMIGRMTAALTAEVVAADPGWSYLTQREEHWAWAVFDAEPGHLLDPAYGSWRAFKRDGLERYLRDALGVETAAELASRTWGELNTIRVRHPLSGALPFVSRWLDMPATPLPGDTDMPRVQTPRFGASARFAVSPGDEASGYFHMPGGQSGHPLSPYYGAGHEDWALGRPTAFLPGDTVDTLRLVPSAN